MNLPGINIIFSSLYVNSSKPFQNLMTVSMFLAVTFIMSDGFFIPIYETPLFVQTLSFFNFMRIQFESLIIILFKGRCQSTPILYHSYGIHQSQLGFNLIHLIIEGIILRLIGFIILLLKSNPDSISTKLIFRKNVNEDINYKL